jgi:cytochrome c peroxidase
LRYLKFIVIVLAVVVCAAAVGPTPHRKPVEQALTYIKCQTDSFSFCLHRLRSDINAINSSDPRSIRAVIAALKSCRVQYKRISFFLDYFYPQQGKLFNAPAKKEIEEPELEFEEPQSFQQMEAILYGSNPEQKKQELENLALVLDESAAGLNTVYAGFSATDAQLMESIHLELIRIMTLYITGYDAPYLKTGIMESGRALASMRYMTSLFFQPANAESVRFDSILEQAIRFTRSADFDHFDRLIFLTQYALPLEEQLLSCLKIYGWQMSSVRPLNSNAKNLFQGELDNQNLKPSSEMIGLGRKLFFEKSLSGNQGRSCATCHQPDKYFTDQLVANRKINNDSPLRRNTPTLLYAACQSAQFWDGRAVTVQEQIADVLSSPDEMNVSIPELRTRLFKNNKYRPFSRDSLLLQIETALAAYLSTLQPLNSPFDRFIAGDEHTLSPEQKKGFNVFMGKAQCGTCHFAPIFNGSTPPFFNRSEYEVLGVPGLTASVTKTADKDLGRYELYPVSLYRRAFKTPTVRNTTKTGPYMHNGCFKTLRDVIDFYNQGGGAGIGLASPEQTLSEKKLHLSQEEISDIIAFLGSLTDNLKTAGLNQAKYIQ